MTSDVKAVPLKDRSERDFMIITLGGALLAFNGGMLNATTVSGARSLSTAPMTGTSTNIGLGIGHGDFALVGISLGVILSHMLGATMSGYLVPNRTFYLGSPYGRIFKFGSIVLACAAVVDLVFPQSLVSYFLVSFMTGVQNAMTSRYSGNVLRTTHISGSVTDIGLIVGRTLHGQHQNMWKLKINVCLVLGFISGALVAALTQQQLHNYQLFVNVGLFSLIGVCFTVLVKQEKEYRPLLRWLGCLATEAPGGGDDGVGERAAGEDKGQDETGVAAGAPGDEEGLCGPDEEAGRAQAGGEGQFAVVAAGEVELSLMDSQATVVEAALSEPAKPDPSAPVQAVASGQVQWTYQMMVVGIAFLCMNAGFINATTSLSSRELKTSHITGTATSMGLEVASGELGSASVRLAQLGCYLLGAVICGTVVSSDFYSPKGPYGRLFVVGVALLAGALVVHVLQPDSLYFYYLLTCFCGMQSALGAKVKDTIVRTCYMSGCVADIGATLGKMLRRREVSNDTGLRGLKLLGASLVFYISGALLASLVYPVLGSFNILVSVIGFAVLGLLHSYVARS